MITPKEIHNYKYKNYDVQINLTFDLREKIFCINAKIPGVCDSWPALIGSNAREIYKQNINFKPTTLVGLDMGQKLLFDAFIVSLHNYLDDYELKIKKIDTYFGSVEYRYKETIKVHRYSFNSNAIFSRLTLARLAYEETQRIKNHDIDIVNYNEELRRVNLYILEVASEADYKNLYNNFTS
jgi:hypothetical protein